MQKKKKVMPKVYSSSYIRLQKEEKESLPLEFKSGFHKIYINIFILKNNDKLKQQKIILPQDLIYFGKKRFAITKPKSP